MRQDAVSMTAESVQFRTKAKRKNFDEYIAAAQRATYDMDASARLEQQLCLGCFYLNYRHAIAGNAMCYRPCGLCGTELLSGNTNSDVVCGSCAKKHVLCRHCGCDSELRTKRRTFGWLKPKRQKRSGK
jgi:hypothetical protein